MIKKLFIFFCTFACLSALASPGLSGDFRDSKYQVCFTPGNDCTELIQGTIEKAKHEILVQAYSFTSAPIAKALADAQKRGVSVRIILDKSQFSQHYSSAKFFQHNQIPVWKDDTVAIAHNKVMVLDDEVVITGSFNFTKAAQKKNAENLIVIQDKDLAKKYKQNWYSRQKISEKIAQEKYELEK